MEQRVLVYNIYKMYEFEWEPFINKDKRYMTDEEWIKHLEHWIRELKKKIHNLKQEKAELKAENKELKERIAEYDDLTEELDCRKREAKRLWWNAKDSVSTITKIIDGPITYTKDSTWKWVADGKPPIVLC